MLSKLWTQWASYFQQWGPIPIVVVFTQSSSSWCNNNNTYNKKYELQEVGINVATWQCTPLPLPPAFEIFSKPWRYIVSFMWFKIWIWTWLGSNFYFIFSNVHPRGKLIIHSLDEVDYSSFLVIKYGGCGQRYLN